MFRPNQRANVGRGIAARTEPELFRFFNTEGDKPFHRQLFDKQSLDRKANLSAVRVAAPDSGARGHFQIRICQNDHGIFAAKFEYGGDQPFRAGLSNAPPSSHAACEYDFVRRGIDQRLPDLSSALDDSDKVFGKAGVDEEFFDQRATLRGEVARLAHRGISGRDRGNDFAERDGQRIVPRRDDGDDTKRIVSQIATLGFRGRAVMWNSLCAQGPRRVL